MANIEIRQETPTAFYIKVHDTDNVAIIVNDNGLKAGTRFPDGLELIEHIPEHKVALLDIPANGDSLWRSDWLRHARNPARKLDRRINGCTTGSAAVTHAATGNDKSRNPYRRWKDTPLRAIAVPMAAWALKNLLGITTSVHCVAGVLNSCSKNY